MKVILFFLLSLLFPLSSLSSSSTSHFKRRESLTSLPKTASQESYPLQQDTDLPKQHVYKKDSVRVRTYNPLRMYCHCMGIVMVWVTVGMLFYSFCNEWPLPQAFFYAVDAGMSIGFCTEVREVKLTSKLFTIVYILLGASVVGGALALFMQDAMLGLSTSNARDFRILLEEEVFDKADIDRRGVLSFAEFRALMESRFPSLSMDDIGILWTKFDRLQDGVLHFEEFRGMYSDIDRLIKCLREQDGQSPLGRIIVSCRMKLGRALDTDNRIYYVFAIWVLVGILWGTMDQKWDPITATHFAVSALATGGLTAPPVNAAGVLPAKPAIFCGVYCLFGIPLFALTLGHFARVLVSSHVAAIEASALARPLTRDEFTLAAHLTTDDAVVHLSDFIVVHLMRQGKLSRVAIRALKKNFHSLDTDQSGTLTLAQATRAPMRNSEQGEIKKSK